MSINVGIFFGGPSREREISFAGGRTVYDNLDKSLFTPVPIFVDSFRRWYLLDWQYLYRGSIRDFFPPVSLAPQSDHGFQVYQESLGPQDELALEEMGKYIGRRVRREELSDLIDVAFLALHGEYGEDGQLQRELEYVGIPYTGSGIEASEIGMDKALQKELMAAAGFPSPPIIAITKEEFADRPIERYFDRAVTQIGWPMVVRPARQGSSIGVAILQESAGLAGFERAVNAAFFQEAILLTDYARLNAGERIEYVRRLSDLRDGIAFPMDAVRNDHRLTLYTPDDLHDYLEQAAADDGHPLVTLTGHQSEQRVIVEGFIDGKEFSTIVLRKPDGGVVALPPTEIVKYGGELFDYRSKYLPGRSRKVTPIDLPADAIQRIRIETERLFTELGFHVYARIDGFYTEDGNIYLNDPNTTSGMMPSSFFFHQAAEIGLNPSQFLTYIIRTSLQERGTEDLMQRLDSDLDLLRRSAGAKEKVAVLLGGTSFERHISVESGRNVYEKLGSSERYRPIPLFLTDPVDKRSRGADDFALYQLPVNLLLKDNADDIRDKLAKQEEHPVIAQIRRDCRAITQRYADPDVVFEPRLVPLRDLPDLVDLVFIALHGRPGEDGQVQRKLDVLGLPYNGSGPDSSAVTIDKYQTLQLLGGDGLPVTGQYLARREDFLLNAAAFYERVEEGFDYPFIAKPVDDGCSSAVKLLRNRGDLEAYCELTFRPDGTGAARARRQLKLGPKEEWPLGKSTILFEAAITGAGAVKFLEITGGMLTRYDDRGEVVYEVFEPSEALAGGEVLSLEEKFLAGEGQNLTPARLYTDEYDYDHIAPQVKADLERAARLLDVTGYCRIDAFVRIFADGRAETVVIEVNSLPGITPATAIFHQAAIAGYQPYQFIAAILEFARERHDRNRIVPAVAVPTNADPEPSPAPAFPTKKPSKTSLLTIIGKNVLFALLFFTLLFLLLRTSLNWYTNHGESMEIPTFEGMQIEEARGVAEDNDLKLNVTIGAFDPERRPGLVVQQQPRVGSRVKNNRTVYLTILREDAPDVTLPSLVGNYDYNQYVRLLKPKNLKYQVRERQFDARQEDGTILHLYYGDRKITDEDLREGVQVPMGSTIDFVITERKGDDVVLEDFRCQEFGTAEFAITGSQLVIGRVVGNVSSRYDAYVVRTEPPAGTTLETGAKVNVYLSEDLPPGCQ